LHTMTEKRKVSRRETFPVTREEVRVRKVVRYSSKVRGKSNC
jgi:hypothetical protein